MQARNMGKTPPPQKTIQSATDFEQESVGDEPPNIASRGHRSTDLQRQEMNEILHHDSLILLHDQSM